MLAHFVRDCRKEQVFVRRRWRFVQRLEVSGQKWETAAFGEVSAFIHFEMGEAKLLMNCVAGN
jgi:hypothetical protein